MAVIEQPVGSVVSVAEGLPAHPSAGRRHRIRLFGIWARRVVGYFGGGSRGDWPAHIDSDPGRQRAVKVNRAPPDSTQLPDQQPRVGTVPRQAGGRALGPLRKRIVL